MKSIFNPIMRYWLSMSCFSMIAAPITSGAAEDYPDDGSVLERPTEIPLTFDLDWLTKLQTEQFTQLPKEMFWCFLAVRRNQVVTCTFAVTVNFASRKFSEPVRIEDFSLWYVREENGVVMVSELRQTLEEILPFLQRARKDIEGAGIETQSNFTRLGDNTYYYIFASGVDDEGDFSGWPLGAVAINPGDPGNKGPAWNLTKTIDALAAWVAMEGRQWDEESDVGKVKPGLNSGGGKRDEVAEPAGN